MSRHPQHVQRLAKVWGENVANRRKQLGWTQAQLADVAETTQQTISRIENGTNTPTDRLKLVLANRMGIDPNVLFAWPDRAQLVEVA